MSKKKLLLIGLLSVLLVTLGLSLSWFLDSRSINNKDLKKIDRYLTRIEKYPGEAENYKTVSKLYEEIGDMDLSDRYYELYQEIKKANEQKDDRKKEALLKKQIELLKYSRTGGNAKKAKKLGKLPLDKDDPTANIKINKNDIKLQKAVELFKAGYKEYSKENYSLASEKFRESIDEKNDFAKSYAYLAATVFEQKKDVEKATAYAKKSISLDKNEDKAYETLGDVDRHFKKYIDAEKQYRKAISLNKKNYLAYYKLANIKYLEKSFREAIKLYQKSLKIKPSYHKPYLNLSLSFLRVQELSSAKEYLNSSLETTALYEDKARLQKTYSTLAYVYYLKKLHSKSLTYYEKAIALKKNYKDYFHMGLVYEEKNDLKKAKEIYKKSIQINENYASAKFNLGTIYLNEEKYSEALKLFNQVSVLSPKLVANHINAGKCYVAIGQDEKAYEQFQKALKYDQNLPTALIELAKYWKNKGVMDKAISYAEDALNKESINNDKIIYLNELGLIYGNFSLYEQAETSFKRALDIDSTSIPTLENLASLYQIQKLFGKAISNYQTIIKIDKQNAKAYFALGKLLIKQGETEEAKAKLKYIKFNFPSFDKVDEVNDLLKKI